MKIKNNKRKFVYGWIICLVLLCMTGCNGGQQKKGAKKAEGVSWFVPYTQSFAVGHNEFDLLFYCDEQAKSAWTKENIDEVFIRIGSNKTGMSVKSIELTDAGEYYRGTMKISGKFENECWGDMYLLVSGKDKEQQQKYELGECYIIDNREVDYSDITQMQCGGVVKSDEKENVFTYGVIIHIETGRDISIKKIDPSLYRIGLDTDHYIVFSPQEYKEKIENSLDETRFDEIYRDAYTKKKVDSLKNTIDLDLKKGEYYIYFPLTFVEDETPALIQSVIKLEYTDGRAGNGNICFISECFPYFSEYTKSETVVKHMLSNNE